MIPDSLARKFLESRCLVTGGAGFIGSNLTRTLLDLGADVTVIDNMSTGKRENLPSSEALTILEEDVVSYDGLEDVVEEKDFVFHVAAMVGNIKSIKQPVEDARTNVMGSVRLYDACRETNVRKVVYSSSSAMFGEAEVIPIDEDQPQVPESFYALSKMAGEHYALLARSLWGVPTVCLRYFNVYGLPMEYNEYTGVISIFFDRLQSDRSLTIYGDGEQYRDFVYVADIVQANLRAALLGEAGRVYNVGSGRKTTIRDLAETMIDLTGHEVEIHYEDFRAGEVRESLANIHRARTGLGFEPRYDLRTGLREMWMGIQSS